MPPSHRPHSILQPWCVNRTESVGFMHSRNFRLDLWESERSRIPTGCGRDKYAHASTSLTHVFSTFQPTTGAASTCTTRRPATTAAPSVPTDSAPTAASACPPSSPRDLHPPASVRRDLPAPTAARRRPAAATGRAPTVPGASRRTPRPGTAAGAMQPTTTEETAR